MTHKKLFNWHSRAESGEGFFCDVWLSAAIIFFSLRCDGMWRCVIKRWDRKLLLSGNWNFFSSRCCCCCPVAFSVYLSRFRRPPMVEEKLWRENYFSFHFTLNFSRSLDTAAQGASYIHMLRTPDSEMLYRIFRALAAACVRRAGKKRSDVNVFTTTLVPCFVRILHLSALKSSRKKNHFLVVVAQAT